MFLTRLRFHLLFTAVLIIANSLYSFAQPQYLSLSKDLISKYEKRMNTSDSSIHSAIKPYNLGELSGIVDTTVNQGKTTSISMHAEPLFSLQSAYDLANSRAFSGYSVGGLVRGNLGKKVFFQFAGIGGNSDFAGYVDSFIVKSHVVPGLGYAYASKLGYSYQNYSGYISYSPNKVFNFQLGQDKNFWGDGYRSLILSDVANNYPFLKISTKIWKIKYMNLFAAFKDVTNPTGLKSDFKNKYGSFHYLSWNICKRLNIGLFETIIWQGTDTTRTRGYDVNYFNPIIFFRPVEYSLGSSDNALVGASFKVRAFKKQQFYGQLMLDEFLLKEMKADVQHWLHPDNSAIVWGWWANKYGFQLGFKSFDIFKIENLHFQTEFNYVRPYTYSHGSAQQNYGHYNQPLAHPFGANFREQVSLLKYSYKKWPLEGKIIVANYGTDSAGLSFGKNIFQSYANRAREHNNYMGQGIATNLLFGAVKFVYHFKPLQVEAGIINRWERSSFKKDSTFSIYLGIRTDLYNFYNDF